MSEDFGAVSPVSGPGPRAPLEAILAGERELTLPMIRRLHALLDIPAEVLIRAA